MKVLVIYSNDSKDMVNALRMEIADRFGANTVLRLHSTNRKKSKIRHAWHKDAVRVMKAADVIVYVVSPNSSTNENVNWELKKALKLKKHILYLPMTPELKPENPCLYSDNPDTKGKECLAEALKAKEDLFNEIEKFNNGGYLKLFRDNVETGVLLEQYKLFLETSENLMSRRQSVNSFYISANTAIITIAATIFAMGESAVLWPKLLVILALSLPGILLNISWYRMLQSYYINNKGKIKVLSMIETRLSASMYDAEWKAMKNKYHSNKYVSFTDNEKILPGIFLLFFILADLVCIVALILQSIPHA